MPTSHNRSAPWTIGWTPTEAGIKPRREARTTPPNNHSDRTQNTMVTASTTQEDHTEDQQLGHTPTTRTGRGEMTQGDRVKRTPQTTKKRTHSPMQRPKGTTGRSTWKASLTRSPMRSTTRQGRQDDKDQRTMLTEHRTTNAINHGNHSNPRAQGQHLPQPWKQGHIRG